MTWENKLKNRIYDTALPPADAVQKKYLAAISKASGHRRGIWYWMAVPACTAAGLMVLFFNNNQKKSPNSQIALPVIELHTAAGIETADCFQKFHPVYLEARNNPTVSYVDTTIMTDDQQEINEPYSRENLPDSTSRFYPQDHSSYPTSPAMTYSDAKYHSDHIHNALITASTASLAGFLASVLTSGPDNSPITLAADRADGSGTTSCEETTSYQHAFPYRCSFNMIYNIGGPNRITSGLEYTVFNSRIIHSIADDSRQSVQYIGVPLRYERVVTHNDRLDAYLGIGPTLDLCISAKIDGNSITKNPLDLSIAGVSGLQFRLSPKAYAILESQLSWTLSDRIHPCPTYKTERPMMFSLSYGVRVNLN